MCGRKAFNFTWRELHDLLEHGKFPERYEREIRANYNAAPTHELPIIHAAGDGWVVTPSRWGFVPAWWNRPELPTHTINARAETIATSNMFRGAFKSGRCISPVSGYFEWQKLADGTKQPQFIYRADGKPMLLAGVHASRGEGDACVDTYAVITTSAPHGMEHIHDRSPVVIEPEDVGRWLDSATPAAEVQSQCHPAPAGILMWHPVSKAVGSVKNNTPALIEPV